MQACRVDGRLLQPSAPARAIDASFALTGAPQNKVRNVHAIMATHSFLPVSFSSSVAAKTAAAAATAAATAALVAAGRTLHVGDPTSPLPGAKWTHVLTIGLNASFELVPAHLGDDVWAGDDGAVVWTGYQPSGTAGKRPANITLLGPFSATAPLTLPACGYSDFGLHHIAPILPASKMAYVARTEPPSPPPRY